MRIDDGYLSDDLPGAELVAAGLADLRAQRQTAEAALLQMAAPRLRSLGIDVPSATSEQPAGHRLYSLLAQEDRRGAHSRYNALVARMVSFARAAEAEHAAAGRR